LICPEEFVLWFDMASGRRAEAHFFLILCIGSISCFIIDF
jgi:hypothetical protein